MSRLENPPGYLDGLPRREPGAASSERESRFDSPFDRGTSGISCSRNAGRSGWEATPGLRILRGHRGTHDVHPVRGWGQKGSAVLESAVGRLRVVGCCSVPPGSVGRFVDGHPGAATVAGPRTKTRRKGGPCTPGGFPPFSILTCIFPSLAVCVRDHRLESWEQLALERRRARALWVAAAPRTWRGAACTGSR
jgi:hypothetical protein